MKKSVLTFPLRTVKYFPSD